MNTANILALASHIEKLPKSLFDMTKLRHDCGSPACIAGWAADLHGGSPYRDTVVRVYSPPPAVLALKFFDASPSEEERIYDDLFLMRHNPERIKRMRITRAKAARTLRHFAATGEIDWTV